MSRWSSFETDKVTVEVPAPAAGVLADIKVRAGRHGRHRLGAGIDQRGRQRYGQACRLAAGGVRSRRQGARGATAQARAGCDTRRQRRHASGTGSAQMIEEKGLTEADVQGSGRRGQILKEDVAAAAAKPASATAGAASASAAAPSAMTTTVPVPLTQVRAPSVPNDAAREERVRMTRLRQTIARRLKDAQNTAAMLTTFNDVDMSAIMKLRGEYKDLFEKRHHVKLGFMGFFVKACIQALREVPAVNGEIDGEDIVYKNYYHIGVAVSTDRGLVVPVVREADRMSLAEVEMAIADFGAARTRRQARRSRRCRAARSPSPTAACSARCCRRRS